MDDFQHSLREDWSVEAVNLLLHWLADAIERDRTFAVRGRGRVAALPSEYRIAVSRLVTSLPARHCFPCTQSVISAALRPFLDGDYAWRIDMLGVEMGVKQRRQSAAARKAQAAERSAEAAQRRHQWHVRLHQNAAALQAELPNINRGYANALLQGLGRPPTADDEQKVAASFATPVSFLETGVDTEQWFIAQLRRRLTTFRPNDARLHQPGRLEILNVELVRGLRGECGLRVQLLTGVWVGLQTKTLSFMDGSSYQFGCTDKWSPSLLIACADNTTHSTIHRVVLSTPPSTPTASSPPRHVDSTVYAQRPPLTVTRGVRERDCSRAQANNTA